MNIYVILDWEDARILDGPDSDVINSYHKGDTVMDGGDRDTNQRMDQTMMAVSPAHIGQTP